MFLDELVQQLERVRREFGDDMQVMVQCGLIVFDIDPNQTFNSDHQTTDPLVLKTFPIALRTEQQ